MGKINEIEKQTTQSYGSNSFTTTIKEDTVEFDSAKDSFTFNDPIDVPSISIDGQEIIGGATSTVVAEIPVQNKNFDEALWGIMTDNSSSYTFYESKKTLIEPGKFVNGTLTFGDTVYELTNEIVHDMTDSVNHSSFCAAAMGGKNILTYGDSVYVIGNRNIFLEQYSRTGYADQQLWVIIYDATKDIVIVALDYYPDEGEFPFVSKNGMNIVSTSIGTIPEKYIPDTIARTEALGGVKFKIDTTNNRLQYSLDGGSTWKSIY